MLLFHALTHKEWNLQASSSEQRIKLEFESFNIESHPSGACLLDYLKISYATFSWRYCGSIIPGPFTSSGPSLTVRFVTNSHITSSGFLAKWEEVDGEILNAQNGVL